MRHEPITRADYEAAARSQGFNPTPDNMLHGHIQAGTLDNPTTPRNILQARRAHTVVSEKEAGTWTAPEKNPIPNGGCHWCGVPLNARNECDDCGSESTVSKWMPFGER